MRGEVIIESWLACIANATPVILVSRAVSAVTIDAILAIVGASLVLSSRTHYDIDALVGRLLPESLGIGAVTSVIR